MTIAEHDKYLMTAADSLYLLNADEISRKRARDREDYYHTLRTYERDIDALKAENARKDALIAELQARLAARNNA